MVKKITIYDIAKQSGVSAKTVSKVINKKDGVKLETREKILEIVDMLDYHPNIFARSLRVNQPACIGVTFSSPIRVAPFSSNLFLWLFMGLYNIFGKQGEFICFDMFPYELDKSGNYGRGVFDNLFKACIIVGPLYVGDKIVEKIHETGIPYVAFGRLDSFPELSYATVDYEEAAYISTKFFIKRGHKDIALVQAFNKYQPGVERIRGYKRALEEAGLPFSESYVKSVDFRARNLALRVNQLFSNTRATALIDSSGTENGEAICEGLRKAGRKIGKDCEILTWTYEGKGAVLREASAHVWLPIRESAFEGMKLLAKQIDSKGDGPIRVLFNPILDLDRKKDKEIEPSYRFFETFIE